MEKAKQKGGRRSWFRYNVHRVDFVSGKTTVVLAIDLPHVDAAVGHGTPIRGASAVIWKPVGVMCKSGEANYVTVTFDSGYKGQASSRTQAPKAVQSHGQITVVSSNKKQYIYDNTKRAVVELDFRLFQTRTTRVNTAKGERPLYLDLQKRLQYTWHSRTVGGTNRGLVAYRNLTQTVARLAFKDGDKLLQHNKLFGVAHLDAQNNSVTIKELARWSGGRKSIDYPLLIPKKINKLAAALQPNFRKNRVVVSGRGVASMKRWRYAYIYDYEKGLEVGKMKVNGSEYVSTISMSPDASKVLAFISDYKTETLKKIMKFSFKSRKWTELPIPSIH
jgi:hypothetical protein